MSLTTGYSNTYLPTHILKRKTNLNLHFANKGLDAINIANIFHHKSLQANVPAYFKQQDAPIISYTYTSTIASKNFNHRETLQHLNIDDPRLTPPVCFYSSSPFNYNPIGHVIAGDLAIVTNENYVILFVKVPDTVNLNALTGIRISNYLCIPLRIMPGSGLTGGCGT